MGPALAGRPSVAAGALAPGGSAAREVLMQAEVITSSEPAPTVAPLRLLAGLLIALAIGALIAWLVLSVQS